MNKALTLMGIAFALLLAALTTRNADLAWMALPFLVYVGVGFWHALAPGDIRLQATRSVERKGADGKVAFEVGVVIRNRGTRIVRCVLADSPQQGMIEAQGEMKHSAVLRAGEEGQLCYTIFATRASFDWKTVRAAASDPFGLIETARDLPAEATLRVNPELNRFRPLPLRPQRTLHSAGSIPARLGGSGTDFWGVREYHPGDPLRRLDWRLTARHPHQFFTQEFEQEEIAEIGLILDARQKPDVRVGKDSLFEHAARATASLAESFLRQGNRVSLLVYQQQMTSVLPGYGKRQLNRILRALAEIVPMEDSGSLNSLQLVPIHMFSSHSLIVVLSPLTFGDWRLFPRLRAYGYQVLLISPDPIDYARQLLPTDRLSQLAIRLTQLERKMEISNITELWVPVIDWKVSEPLSPLVRNALRHFHIQRQR